MASNHNQPCPPSDVVVDFVRYETKSKAVKDFSNLFTCFQVKNNQSSTSQTNTIIVCSKCGAFELDFFLQPGLRQKQDNNPANKVVSRRYLCQTPWSPTSAQLIASPFLSSSSSPNASTLPPKSPPILSHNHLSASPLRENNNNNKRQKRTTANYSPGRFSYPAPEYQNENNQQETNKSNSDKRTKNNKKNRSSAPSPPPPKVDPPLAVLAETGYLALQKQNNLLNEQNQLIKHKDQLLEKLMRDNAQLEKELFQEKEKNQDAL